MNRPVTELRGLRLMAFYRHAADHLEILLLSDPRPDGYGGDRRLWQHLDVQHDGDLPASSAAQLLLTGWRDSDAELTLWIIEGERPTLVLFRPNQNGQPDLREHLSLALPVRRQEGDAA